MAMTYPLTFRPNCQIDLYDNLNNHIAGPKDCQVFKPLIATSANTYTSGGSTIFSPGATIIRAISIGFVARYDQPGAFGWYVIFVGDALNQKWRVASGFNWWQGLPNNMPYMVLGIM